MACKMSRKQDRVFRATFFRVFRATFFFLVSPFLFLFPSCSVVLCETGAPGKNQNQNGHE